MKYEKEFNEALEKFQKENRPLFTMEKRAFTEGFEAAEQVCFKNQITQEDLAKIPMIEFKKEFEKWNSAEKGLSIQEYWTLPGTAKLRAWAACEKELIPIIEKYRKALQNTKDCLEQNEDRDEVAIDIITKALV